MRQPSFVYSIDHNDSLLYVDEPWLAFARENRAPELTRDHVLGRSLWEFVAGAETRLLYESLFLKLRTSSGSIELPFRCDSPDRFRFMRLILESGPRESIRMTGILERERERGAGEEQEAKV